MATFFQELPGAGTTVSFLVVSAGLAAGGHLRPRPLRRRRPSRRPPPSRYYCSHHRYIYGMSYLRSRARRFVPGTNRFVAGTNRFVPGTNRFVPGTNRFVPGPARVNRFASSTVTDFLENGSYRSDTARQSYNVNSCRCETCASVERNGFARDTS